MTTSERTAEIALYDEPEQVLILDAWIGLGVALTTALVYVAVQGLTIFTLEFVAVLGVAILAVPLLHGLLAPRGMTIGAAIKHVRYTELDGERPFARHQLMLQLVLTTLVIPGVALILLVAVVALLALTRDDKSTSDGGERSPLAGAAAWFLATPPRSANGLSDDLERERHRAERAQAAAAPTRAARGLKEAGQTMGLVRRPLVVWR